MNMIADYQNRCRDNSWRIKTIPWWEGIEVTSSTPLLNRLAFFGMLLIIIPVVGSFLKFLPGGALFAAPFGIPVILVSALLHNWDYYRNWIPLEAQVVDFEYQERTIHISEHNYKKIWCFRAICKFSINGNVYQVTPDVHEHFKSKEDLLKFYESTISGPDDNKLAKLYYNPQNFLQTIFHARPEMGPVKYLGFKYPDN